VLAINPLPSSTQPQGPLHNVNDAVSPPPTTERNNETFPSEPEDTPSPSSNDDDDDDDDGENDENGDVYMDPNAYSADVSGETAAQFDDDDGYEADREDNNL
jgi:hypothetical protein